MFGRFGGVGPFVVVGFAPMHVVAVVAPVGLMCLSGVSDGFSRSGGRLVGDSDGSGGSIGVVGSGVATWALSYILQQLGLQAASACLLFQESVVARVALVSWAMTSSGPSVPRGFGLRVNMCKATRL